MPRSSRVFASSFRSGEQVTKGQELTEGVLSPHEVLRIRGLADCHNYLIREVQKPYRQQGVDINDKHTGGPPCP